MTTPLADLVAAPSQDEEEQTILGSLALANLPALSWQTLSYPRTLLKGCAAALANYGQTIASIAKGGFNDLAAGDWLDLLSASAYQNTRATAVSTKLRVRLTCAATAGPYTIAANTVLKFGETLRYTGGTGATLASGGTLDVDFTAETGGAAYNLALGSTVSLASSLAGVTVALLDVGGGTAIVTVGADKEGDDSLRARNATKWATLGTGGAADAYENWARTASPTVNRVQVSDANPDGAGTLRVYLANSTGGATTLEVTTADAAIQAQRAETATVRTLACPNRTITVTATVYVTASKLAAAQAAVSANFTALTAAALIASTVYGTVVLDQLQKVDGVRNVVGVFADTALAAGEVPVFTFALAWVAQ